MEMYDDGWCDDSWVLLAKTDCFGHNLCGFDRGSLQSVVD